MIGEAERPLPIADLHCHYPMHLLIGDPGDRSVAAQMPLKGRSLLGKFQTLILRIAAALANFRGRRGELAWRVSLDGIVSGRVQLVCSVAYCPDEEFGIHAWGGDPISDGAFDRLTEQLDLVDAALALDPRVGLVRTRAELAVATSAGRSSFVHTIEGGFHIGDEAALIDQRVGLLKQRGVACITIAHLFWRGIATDAPALPNLPEWLVNLLWPQPKRIDGLSPLGVALIEAMYRHRILVDLSHMNAAAIARTLALLDGLDQGASGEGPTPFPVTATHCGYRFGDRSYMLPRPTIEAIARRGGVVGLIMGEDLLCDSIPERGFDAIARHVDVIHAITGGFDNIGIGSDLDGFVDPTIEPVQRVEDLARLGDWLVHRYGYEAAEAICFNNARRVIEAMLDP